MNEMVQTPPAPVPADKPRRGRIAHRDYQLVLALAKAVRNVEAERIKASIVAADDLAIDPNLRLPVHRPEVQQQPLLTEFRGLLERPPIPEALIRQEWLLHARKGRFDGKRHENIPIPLCRRLGGVRWRDCVIP